MKTLLAAAIVVFSSLAFAKKAPPQACPEIIDRVGLTQIHQQSNREQTNCFISATNSNNYMTLVYRDYLVSNDSMMVFVSLGDGPEDKTTGAKEFYFFPRDVRTAKYSIGMDEKFLTIEGRFDFDFIFDSQTSQLVEMTNANIKVDPKISASNDSGVQIMPTKGLVYEIPFKLGSAPSGDLRRTGYFKDAFNHKCAVKVGMIFKSIGNGETEIKLNDLQLKNLLAQICPEIKY